MRGAHFLFARTESDSRAGFAIAELVVALMLLSMAIYMVVGLGRQVAGLSLRSRQVAAVVEMRSKTSSMTQSTGKWLERLRSATATQGIFAACLPDSRSVAAASFSCPPIDDDILASDPELKKIAGENLHVSSVPLVDLVGDKIAGSREQPLYLDTEGRRCESNGGATCPFMSTGYFLRSNAQVSGSPGDIRFIVKVERNPEAPRPAGTPMRAQYMSVDVGEQWENSEGRCPTDTVKMGYLTTGEANCVSLSKSCDAGQVAVGALPSGEPNCKFLPTCEYNEGVILGTDRNQFACTTQTPCGAGQLHLGYMAGTGEAMCSSPTVRCNAGELQVGHDFRSGVLVAQCLAVPECARQGGQVYFVGDRLECASSENLANNGVLCKGDQVAYGISRYGDPLCRTLNASDLKGLGVCADGTYLAGVDERGEKVCRSFPVGSPIVQAN